MKGYQQLYINNIEISISVSEMGYQVKVFVMMFCLFVYLLQIGKRSDREIEEDIQMYRKREKYIKERKTEGKRDRGGRNVL